MTLSGIAGAAAIAFLPFTTTAKAAPDTLVVRVEGIAAARGFVDLTVYRDDRNYLSDDSFVVSNRKAVAGLAPVFLTVILPAGRYAYVVYQDLNSNGTLDANWFGFPVEPMAFSRPFCITIRAPRFDEIGIAVDKPRDTVTVRLGK